MKRHLYFLTVLALLPFYLSAQITVGLFQNDPGSFDGYTLFASNGYTSTYLVDNCGRLINEWPGTALPGNAYYLSTDGFLYRSVAVSSNTFSGGGIGGRIEKLDWEGNLVWEYQYSNNNVHQHHDIEILPNGNIMFLAWETKTMEEAIAAGRNPDYFGDALWPDHILEIEPIGNAGGPIAWEWHLWDHLIQDFDSSKENFGVVADHPEAVDVNYIGSLDNVNERDWTHCNSIAYNAERDEIIISSREFNELWTLDHSTTKEEAAGHSGGNAGKGGDLLYRWGNPRSYQRGTEIDQKLFSQHDAHWIPQGLNDAGKVMIFNNGKDRPGGNASSVDIIVPSLDTNGNYLLENDAAFGPEVLDWTYFPDITTDFYSAFISGAQRLPNGNTLICEGIEGRIFEINTDEEVLWEYINPVGLTGPIAQGEYTQGNTVFRAYRYPVNHPAFTGKDLTPGPPIELEPIPNDCQIMNSTNNLVSRAWTVFPNPVKEELHISVAEGNIGTVRLVNALGVMIKTEEIIGKECRVLTKHLQAGVYFLFAGEEHVQKIIKSN
ncbi:MAG: hypothetical protein ACI8YQ_004352 [Polaribacter sp.]|jgi:hypothetical protein